MTNVVELDIVTTLPIDPARVLRKAAEAGLTEVVVIGLDPDGKLWLSWSGDDVPEMLFHLELAKRRILDALDDGYDPPGYIPPAPKQPA